MSRRRWLPVIVTLTCLTASPAQAQLLSDPSSLRHICDEQTRWVEGLASSRRDGALRFMAVAKEILALPDRPGSEKTQLLGEAQRLADLVASLAREIVDAASMVRETRERLIRVLESRASSLRQAAGNAEAFRRLLGQV